MPRTIPLAQYLFTRLRQLGCHSLHGVPGDFTLRTLEHLPASKVKWIGNANELCAGYAADGYARAPISKTHGYPKVGALITTCGVGELSAINAVVGSYAESVPVVHMVGTPSRRLWRSSKVIHHTLGNGRMEVFKEMAEKITCAQANISCDAVEEAIERYDRALEQCMRKKRPVYVNVPFDIVEKDVPAEMLEKPLKLDEESCRESSAEIKRVSDLIMQRLQATSKPLLIADGLAYSWDFKSEANEIVKLANIPAMCFSAGKGVIDECHPSWVGPLTAPTEYSTSTDLVLMIGSLLSDTNTAAWTAIPDPAVTITFNLDNVDIAEVRYAVPGKQVLGKLVEMLQAERDSLPQWPKPYSADLRHTTPSASSSITQDALWSRLSSWLKPHDTILLANGTPLIGGREMHLPPDVKVIASGIWCSIGQMLPAAQGIALAKRDHSILGRTTLFEGDGLF